MRSLTKVFGYAGLNTRADATGLPVVHGTVVQDMRVVGKDLEQRLGMVRVGQIDLGNKIKGIDCNGTDEYCANAIDTRVWAMGTEFTVEMAVAADTLGDSEAVLTAGSTTPAITIDMSSSKWRVRIVDSADATTTLTSTDNASTSGTDTIQITRVGADLTFRLNNSVTSGDTGTMTATTSLKTPVGDLRVGRSGSTEYFDGTIDYLRVFTYAKTDHNDRLIRLPNPRSSYVSCDMNFSYTGTLAYDKSRYENHLIVTGAPSKIASLCHNAAPVRALSMGVDSSFRKQLLIVSGSYYYIAAVG